MHSVRRALGLGIGLIFIIAVVIPLRAPFRARDKAQNAEVVAAAERRPILVEPGASTSPLQTPLLRMHRAPETLVWPVIDRRLEAELSSLIESWPAPYCLDVRIDGRAVFNEGEAIQTPASVQKIFTAASAMSHLATESRFTTVVAATSVTVDGVLEGDLWVIGGGDPLLTTQEYSDAYSRQPQLRTAIEDLADAIAATGLTSVSGQLLGDESRYDKQRYVETWPPRYRAQHNSGPMSALTVNDGFTRWSPTRIDASEPAQEFLRVLRNLLTERGVRIRGSLELGEAPLGLAPVASVDSPTVGEIVQQMLRESDNNTAEMLLKELGLAVRGSGSTAAGASVVAETTSRLIGGTAPIVLDGSGLDPGNGVSCSSLVGLLDLFGPESVIGEGLPVAGETGTLAHRFIDTDVAGVLHAKTGLLNNVTGLAGFMDDQQRGHITFAQLLNGVPLDGRLGFDIQEELTQTLLRHLDHLDPEELAP